MIYWLLTRWQERRLYLITSKLFSQMDDDWLINNKISTAKNEREKTTTTTTVTVFLPPTCCSKGSDVWKSMIVAGTHFTWSPNVDTTFIDRNMFNITVLTVVPFVKMPAIRKEILNLFWWWTIQFLTNNNTTAHLYFEEYKSCCPQFLS